MQIINLLGFPELSRKINFNLFKYVYIPEDI